jgi:hypothetical protein
MTIAGSPTKFNESSKNLKTCGKLRSFLTANALTERQAREEAGIVPAVGESKGAIGTSWFVLRSQSESEGESK